MLLTGGLFAGGVLSIARERLPAWREADPESFRATFAHTLQRVDRLQPALLAACLVSTIGFAVSSAGTARALAEAAAACELAILAGSLAWLVPIQRRLAAPVPGGPQPEADTTRLLAQWSGGHIVRTILALVFLLLAITAAVI
jgi:hypothetical protein